MDTNTILLILAALLPAFVLCGYVFAKDRVEKEPLGLLLKLFFAGIACCFPAVILEETFIEIIDLAFLKLSYTGYLVNSIDHLHLLTEQLLGVALVEEGLKWICLNLITKKNREFNCLFDGLLYAIFVSLGFAALENILYVLENGWVNAVMRGILSVPGHMFFAVMMGYYYSYANILDLAKDMETDFRNRGLITSKVRSFSSTKNKWLSILVPISIHCAYNFCCSAESELATLTFIILIIFLYIHCFKKIKNMSAGDAANIDYARVFMLKKYPYLEESLIEVVE